MLDIAGFNGKIKLASFNFWDGGNFAIILEDFMTTNKKRGFEVVSKYHADSITLPVRTTKNAAGYDLCAASDFVVPSVYQNGWFDWMKAKMAAMMPGDAKQQQAQAALKPVLVPTGIKAYMQPDEVLILANRSSAPLKRNLVLPNGIGVIDADYYNNSSNEGEIFVQLLNFGTKDYHIKAGERIAQAIFMPYLLADEDNSLNQTRAGGFGSTGK